MIYRKAFFSSSTGLQIYFIGQELQALFSILPPVSFQTFSNYEITPISGGRSAVFNITNQESQLVDLVFRDEPCFIHETPGFRKNQQKSQPWHR